MIRVILDSAAPNSGVKPFNSDIDVMRSHYTCRFGGRLPHPETITPVVSLSGAEIRVEKSTWLQRITINNANNVGQESFNSFNTIFDITGSEAVTPTGNPGVVIARTYDSAVQLGAVNADGSTVGTIEFIEIPGLPTGDRQTDYDTVKALVGADAVVILGYWDGVAVTEAGLAEWCLDETNIYMQGTLDMQSQGNITGLLPNPTDPLAPVTNQQFFATIGNDTNDFGLNIQKQFIFINPTLVWDSYLNGNPAYEYEVRRRTGNNFNQINNNNPDVTVATLPPTTTTWTDPTPFVGWNSYQIIARKIGTNDELIMSDRIVATEYDNTGGIPAGYYGDGSDGEYIPGTDLQRGRVYNFTGFVTNQPFSIVGTGTAPVVFVAVAPPPPAVPGTGVIDIQAGSNINATFSTIQDLTGIITVGGVNVDTSVAIQTGGDGGNGGAGGDSAGSGPTTRNPGGAGGQEGFPGQNGIAFGGTATAGTGGQPGQLSNPGTGGGGGGGGDVNAPNLQSTPGGNGGDGGGHNEYQTAVLFITDAPVTIDSAVSITMPGASGQNGTNGQGSLDTTGAWQFFGPFIFLQGAGTGGGGGGGGGAGGQDGGKFIICSNNTVTNNAIAQNYIAGAGGAGGNPGIAGINTTVPPSLVAENALGGWNGAMGDAGQPGVSGNSNPALPGGFQVIVIP